LKAAAQQRGEGWLPTIVLEFEAEISDIAIGATKSLKEIVCDREAARGILVLSDVNALFSLPKDQTRQNIIWVEDMTEEQAKKMVQNLHPELELSDSEFNDVFGKIGTRPKTLEQVFGEQDWKSAVESHLAEARRQVVGFLGLEAERRVPIKSILLKLIENGSRTQDYRVTSESFPHSLASSPEEIVPLLKKHVIMYHPILRSYKFFSKAHQVEAEKLLQKKG